MILGIKTGQNDSPHASAPGEKQFTNSVGAPRPDKIHRQKDETQPVKNGRPVADHSENRREHYLEKRHVIIEHIPVLDEAACPCPDHVGVLRLIAVETVVRHVCQLDHDHEREETRSRYKLRWPRHAKVLSTAFRE